jgi:hypothetical protein
MKTISILIIAFIFTLTVNAKTTNTEITKANSEGFTVSLESVVDNMDSSYTIVIRVANNGKNSFTCKELSDISIEAMPGTYSNINIFAIMGDVTFSSFTDGPDLGVVPFQGFKYNGFKNLGRDKSGSFKIIYTISGNLQDQRISLSTGLNNWIVRFTTKDFENIMNINKANIAKIKNSDIDYLMQNTSKNTINTKKNVKNDIFSTEGQFLAVDIL